MAMKFETLCDLYFAQTQKELSDSEFQDIQKVIGMWPLPDQWDMPSKKSSFLTFPSKGLCIIEAPFQSLGNFKISLSVKMGEVRIGFLFPDEFNALIDECRDSLEAFIAREYKDNSARNNRTLTNFANLPGGQVIIDFIIYDQFADLHAMEAAIAGNEKFVVDSMAKSMAMTVSHLYCSIISILLTQQSVIDSGLVEDIWKNPETGCFSRLYVIIDPNQKMDEKNLKQVVCDLSGEVRSLYRTNDEVSILLIDWAYSTVFEVIEAQRDLRSWALNLAFEITPHSSESEEIEIHGLIED